jgi:hypothetical protein
MTRAIEALRNCIVDDVHIGNRFADMCETLLHRVRSRMVRMTTGNGNGSAAGNLSSRAASPKPNGGRGSPQMLPPRTIPLSSTTPQPVPFNFSTSQPPSEHSPFISNDANSALFGISTETYDPSSLSHSVMPPPDFANDHFGNYSGMDGIAYGLNQGYDPNNSGDWFALPLDGLVDSYGADITATSYGPDVNGIDVLDVLLAGDNTGTSTPGMRGMGLPYPQS